MKTGRFRGKIFAVPHFKRQLSRYLKWFPDLWDRIIDFMHCEDKLDDFITGQLKFSSTSSEITMERLCQEVLQELDLAQFLDGNVIFLQISLCFRPFYAIFKPLTG